MARAPQNIVERLETIARVMELDGTCAKLELVFTGGRLSHFYVAPRAPRLPLNYGRADPPEELLRLEKQATGMPHAS
jgi:hypothetical protein